MERRAVAAIAALDDDVRAALYAYARASDQPVTREDAAAAVGISRKLAAFHLDKLVAAGLLSTRIEAVGTRRVGRAPKVYEPSAEEITVHLPPREPGLLVDILLSAVGAPPGEQPIEATVLEVARERGVAAGAAERDRLRPGRIGSERSLSLLCGLLEQHGFEPCRSEDGLRLRNCPFHPHVTAAPALVCGLNHAYLGGLISGLGADSAVSAVLEPGVGACCVQVHPQRAAAPSAS